MTRPTGAVPRWTPRSAIDHRPSSIDDWCALKTISKTLETQRERERERERRFRLPGNVSTVTDEAGQTFGHFQLRVAIHPDDRYDSGGGRGGGGGGGLRCSFFERPPSVMADDSQRSAEFAVSIRRPFGQQRVRDSNKVAIDCSDFGVSLETKSSRKKYGTQ